MVIGEWHRPAGGTVRLPGNAVQPMNMPPFTARTCPVT